MPFGILPLCTRARFNPTSTSPGAIQMKKQKLQMKTQENKVADSFSDE